MVARIAVNRAVMNKTLLKTGLIVARSLFLWVGLCSVTTNTHCAETAKVNYRDLGGKVSIIGALGEPLGQIIAVGASIAEDSKRSKDSQRPPLVISEVSHVQIPSVQLEYSLAPGVELKKAKRLTLIGYETGGFKGTPTEAWRHTQPFQTRGFGFSTSFIVLKVVSVDE